MADDEMLCESLGEQIHRARKEGAKSERERILGIVDKRIAYLKKHSYLHEARHLEAEELRAEIEKG